MIESKKCAFTGHRPHKFPWKSNEGDPRCVALKGVLADQIAALVTAGVTEFYNGGADGTDFWTAQIVLSLREGNPELKLHCVLPHRGQADRWDSRTQEQYQFILNQADTINYISDEYYEGCLLDRNRRLVESAGLLLAVFNGVRRSGTGATVNYARKMGREIIIINPLTLQITCEGILKY